MDLFFKTSNSKKYEIDNIEDIDITDGNELDELLIQYIENKYMQGSHQLSYSADIDFNKLIKDVKFLDRYPKYAKYVEG